MPDKKKRVSARKALLKMMLDNDKTSDKMEAVNKARKKVIVKKQTVILEKKEKNKPKKQHVLITELSNVLPDLKHGIKSEYKKIKKLFKDNKKK